MRVLVTGATGFVGRHVVRALRALSGCEVIASGRRVPALRDLGVEFVPYDLADRADDCFRRLGQPDVLIHLAWEPVGNYEYVGHIDQTFPLHYQFLRAMIRGGLPVLACAGSCFEYGLRHGPLSENAPTRPVTCYGVAKDTLHRFLECLQRQHPFELRWLRVFYLYGEGQTGRALIPQLDQALAAGQDAFSMSNGEQLRDYLPVETVAESIVKASLQCVVSGAINICAGQPIALRSLVEHQLRERGRTLELRLGHEAQRYYEPFAFWGDDRRLRRAVAAFDSGRTWNRDGLACRSPASAERASSYLPRSA